MKYTLGVRPILILLVLISMLPVLVALVQTSMLEQERALEKAKISLRIQTQLRANSLAQMLEGVHHMLTVIAHSSSIRNAKPQECDQYLQDLQEHFPRYAHLAFADKAGNIVCRSAPDRSKAVNIGDRQYFQGAVRTGKFTVGQYMVSRVLGTPSIGISLPVYLPGGEFQGVQYAVLELTGMQEQFSAVSVLPDVTDVITDADGTVLASAGNRTQRVGEHLAEGFLLNAVRKNQSVVDKAVDDNGQKWLYAVQFVKTEGAGGLAVSSMVSGNSVLLPVVQRLQLELAMLALLALAASLLAWRMGDRLLAAPIERLLAKVRALEQGETTAAQPADTTGGQVHELKLIDRGINDLAAALTARSSQRDMALEQLHEQKKSLEKSEQRYRAQFEASPQPMWVLDTETLAFLMVNAAAVAHYGYSREEFMKMAVTDLYLPQDVAVVVASLRQSGTEAQEGIPRKHRCKNGDMIYVEITSHALDWDGRPARMTIAYDVTSRILAKQAWERLHETLEHKVAQRTSELELANDELEAFSYSVSHDLRGPLHTIDGFCAALLERHSASLPPQAIHYLGRIRAGTVQMNSLIADLLSFAKTGRAPVALRQVDLAPLAANAVAQLRQRFPERQVSVEIEQPLPARCDPGLLTIVLENLIGNAWKFTSQTPQASIRIGAAGAREYAKAYVISDNGAGFDPAYAGKLFKAFQRLHSAREFEGTGIGLAIVHRIIQRHGGRAWAESEPGKGARFYFSLPEQTDEGGVG